MNVDAVEYLLEPAKRIGSHFIHLSTDFVFDGSAGPYREEDVTNPQSVYARSKLESEQLVMNSGIDWTIMRTIIIYGVTDGEQRSNLVLWVKSSLQQGKQINVITDQFRSPTLAEDLAEAIIYSAIHRKTGLYHVSGDESDLESIFDLAHRVADYFKLEASLLHPVTTAQLAQPAPRPPRTGFILDKARKELNYTPHTFDEGLKIIADQLHERGSEPL
jgi:dTDP-4-dehydrorhamnose reductase